MKAKCKGGLEGKILACDKCATMPTQMMIEKILDNLTNAEHLRFLLTCPECHGSYRIMTKAYAASVAIQYAVKSVLDKGEYQL